MPQITLSTESLQLLNELFTKGSPLQMPVGLADQVVEIRDAVHKALEPSQ